MAVPFASLIEAIRGITLNGNDIGHYGTEVLIGVAWTLAMLTVATTVYRFDQK